MRDSRKISKTGKSTSWGNAGVGGAALGVQLHQERVRAIKNMQGGGSLIFEKSYGGCWHITLIYKYFCGLTLFPIVT